MTLHILNGDAIVEPIQKSGIQGDLMVWREMLCEGKSVSVPGTEAFWEGRKAFFEKQLGYPPSDYQEKMINEFDKLSDLDRYNETVLWFEYDLFCQINLVAALAWAKEKMTQTISLVCVGEHPSSEKLVGLGELEISDYPALFAERVLLNRKDIDDAVNVWNAWISPDHSNLKSFTEKTHPTFSYLAPALKAHFTRFPDPKTGLNQIETEMLQLIGDGISSERKLIGTMLRKENYLGFGDLQYFDYLDSLAPLLKTDGELLELNELGKSVLAGEKSFTEFIEKKDAYYFGGARKYE